jgi:hypothetical protein
VALPSSLIAEPQLTSVRARCSASLNSTSNTGQTSNLLKAMAFSGTTMGGSPGTRWWVRISRVHW